MATVRIAPHVSGVRSCLVLTLFAAFGFLAIEHPAVNAAILRPSSVDVDRLMREAMQASRSEKWAEADAKLTQVIESDDPPSVAWYWRGRARFCLGKVKEAALDFDQYYEAEPGLRSRQWERGITLYYAGRFKDGAAQFELYQTYHDSDVENATWRYLCEAKLIGPDKAQKNILDIGPDSRVPMRKIYELYAGEAKVEDVFDEVENARLSDDGKQAALFYANLYVGLWLESRGKSDEARPYIRRAGIDLPIDHYMGWVGRIHWKLEQERNGKDGG